MRFISNGDYIFPFRFPDYWAQHVYTWSYQHGAANPDGIIRLPGRMPDFVVFALFGNVAEGYFYVLSCLVVAFLAFYWFARTFLGAQRRGTALIGAIFFTLNPIFLGNLSKVGLILAAAMLPVCLVALKQAFERKQFWYLLVFILALNVSLLHPFTFSVDLIASGLYALVLVRGHQAWVRDNILKFVAVAAVGLCLNAYFILPLASLGTVDKGALSDSATSTSVDYTSLVDIANTGDIFTGLSLSKNVLKDYEFYGPMTWPLYFLGAFALYAILFGVYVRVEKRAKPADRRRFMAALALFLLLLVLSTATYLHADIFIKFLIGMPGGWMFRSPLKWQLYMPLALFTALVIALKYVRSGMRLKLLYAALGLAFVLMNGYLFKQVYARLLTPRSLAYFSGLERLDLSHKNLLFINAASCAAFAGKHPTLSTELNQVFVSNNLQVKRVDSGSINAVLLSQYDYVMGCKGTLDPALLAGDYHFRHTADFADHNYQLYTNSRPAPYLSAQAQIFALQQPENLGGKYAVAGQTLHTPFTFIAAANKQPAIGLQDIFDTLAPGNIRNGLLTNTVRPVHAGAQQLYIEGGRTLYYRVDKATVQLSAVQRPGLMPMRGAGGQPAAVTVPDGQDLTLSYSDPAYSYQNFLTNPSLEDGLWNKTVGDCDNYDDQPAIHMSLITAGHTDGSRALELSSTRHIACTGPVDVTVQPGEHYLLSFDYQSRGEQYAGYFAGFDDAAGTSIGQRLPDKSGQWTTFVKEIAAPPGAKRLHLLVYAYAANAPGVAGTARYDNFALLHVPDVQNKFFLVSGMAGGNRGAPAVSARERGPTKTLVHIAGASQPFYLASTESFHRQWQLSADTGAHGLRSLLPATAALKGATHIRMNGAMNGWLIDPTALCGQGNAGCSRNADGTYDLRLVMEFIPQRWFYTGSIISGITFVGVFWFIGRSMWRNRMAKKAGRQWR